MLEAACRLGDREDVHFLFVGTGAQKAGLAEALRRPEFAHCHQIEWIDAAEVPAFWGASYVHYWALHHNELDRLRFQAKLYEALATGTPTVIAVEGLMSDILGRTSTGVTVAPGDAAALSREIAHLLDDADHHRQISQNARRYAEEHFDPQRAVDAYEAILKQVAGLDP